MMDFYFLGFVLFVWYPMFIVPACFLLVVVCHLFFKTRLYNPFVFSDLLLPFFVPACWFGALRIVNPGVGMGGFGLICLLSPLCLVVIVIRHLAVRFWSVPRTRAILIFGLMQFILLIGVAFATRLPICPEC